MTHCGSAWHDDTPRWYQISDGLCAVTLISLSMWDLLVPLITENSNSQSALVSYFLHSRFSVFFSSLCSLPLPHPCTDCGVTLFGRSLSPLSERTEAKSSPLSFGCLSFFKPLLLTHLSNAMLCVYPFFLPVMLLDVLFNKSIPSIQCLCLSGNDLPCSNFLLLLLEKRFLDICYEMSLHFFALLLFLYI